MNDLPARPRVVVFGYHLFGHVGLKALEFHGFDIVGIVTHEDDPNETVWWDSLIPIGKARNIPVFTPAKEELSSQDFTRKIRTLRPDFLFSFYYRYLIPNSLLKLVKPECALNLHGSLLPAYRGRASINWALVDGLEETGVSLHCMTQKPDAGDLVGQRRVPIAAMDTAFTLYHKMVQAAKILLDEVLPDIRDGLMNRTPMDLFKGSYFGRRTPMDGMIDWNRSSREIFNLIRATTHPYPGAFTFLDSRIVTVWWALPSAWQMLYELYAPGTIVGIDQGGITVRCGTGVLRLIMVQGQGEPELPAAAFSLQHNLFSGRKFESLEDSL